MHADVWEPRVEMEGVREGGMMIGGMVVGLFSVVRSELLVQLSGLSSLIRKPLNFALRFLSRSDSHTSGVARLKQEERLSSELPKDSKAEGR